MKRAIINGKLIENPTPEQLAGNTRFGDAAAYHRDADRDDNYVDIIQPYIGNKPNPEFISAYPERAKDYFSDDELKNM